MKPILVDTVDRWRSGTSGWLTSSPAQSWMALLPAARLCLAHQIPLTELQCLVDKPSWIRIPAPRSTVQGILKPFGGVLTL